MLHPLIWMIYWYIANPEKEYVEHVKWTMQSLLDTKLYLELESVSFMKKLLGTWNWLFWQRAFQWMKILLRQWETDADKGRQRLAGWTTCLKSNRFSDFEIITNSLFLSIGRSRTIDNIAKDRWTMCMGIRTTVNCVNNGELFYN